MKNRLRCLALTVDEAGPGDFYWRLLEGLGNPPSYHEIARASSMFLAYDIALAAGYGALQRVAGADLEYGPRRSVEDEDTPAIPARAESTRNGAPLDIARSAATRGLGA